MRIYRDIKQYGIYIIAIREAVKRRWMFSTTTQSLTMTIENLKYNLKNYGMNIGESV